MKLPIAAKMQLTLVLLAVVALLVFGAGAFLAVGRLGRDAGAWSRELGESAVDDSVSALTAQAEDNLLRLVRSQAELSNVQLEQVKAQVLTLARFAEHLWRHPGGYPARRSYSTTEQPSNALAVSSYMLVGDTAPAEAQAHVELSAYMDDLFIQVFTNNARLDCLCFGTETGVFRGYPWMTGLAPSYDHRQRTWYRQAAEAGDTIWTEPYIHAATKELIITCAHPFNGPNGSLAGVVEADLTLDVASEEVITSLIGRDGYAFILDEHGHVIARPGMRRGSTPWDQAFETRSLFESPDPVLRLVAEAMTRGGEGVARVAIDEQHRYVAYAPIRTTGWSLGIVKAIADIVRPAVVTRQRIGADTEAALDRIDGQTRLALLLGVGAFLFITALISVAAQRLAQRITRPIQELRKGAGILGGGDLDHRLTLRTGDEMEELAGAFNRMATNLKDHMRRLAETTAAKERIQSELQVARDIQASMLPRIFPPFPERTEFDLFARLEPAREVGGDLYDFAMLDDSHLFFCIGDVSGKGVPAALFMAMTKTLLGRAARDSRQDPAEILHQVNRQLCIGNDYCLFVTLFCGMLDVRTGELRYSNGGHNPPLLVPARGEPSWLDLPKGTVVGVMSESQYSVRTVTLGPGDSLLVYTDGVTEAMDPDHKLYGEDRFQALVGSLPERTPARLIDATFEDVKAFADGAEQSDDIAVMSLRFRGSPEG